MRNYPLIPIELKSSGTKDVTHTLSTTGETERAWDLIGLRTKMAKHWLYVDHFSIEATATINQTGGTGVAINRDKLDKLIVSYDVSSPLLPAFIQSAHTRGAVVGNIIGPMGVGEFRRTRPQTAQIPAADGAYATTIKQELPVARQYLEDPLDTAHLLGLFEGGQMLIRFAPNTVFVPDSPGNNVTVAITVRVTAMCVPNSDLWIPGHVRNREYTVPASGNNFRLVGFGKGPSTVDPKFSLGSMMWLGAPTGIGLLGPTTVETINRLTCGELGIADLQQTFTKVDAMLQAVGTAPQNVQALITQGCFPFAFAATDFDPIQTADLYGYPIAFPSRLMKLSNMRRFDKSLNFEVDNIGFTVTPGTGNHRFLTEEYGSYNAAFEASFRDQFGVGEGGTFLPKSAKGKVVNDRLLSIPGIRRKFYGSVEAV